MSILAEAAFFLQEYDETMDYLSKCISSNVWWSNNKNFDSQELKKYIMSKAFKDIF